MAGTSTLCTSSMSSSSAPSSSSTIHTGLPDEVISQVLASFCDGRSMSTFFHVLCSDRTLRTTSFDTIRNTLVRRFKSLAADDRLKPDRCEEMRDIIAIIREDVRTSNYDSETGRLENGHEGRITDSGKTIITIVSEWCAIVDYFDVAVNLEEYVVWVGEINTRFGRLNKACIRTPFWTITSLQFFYEQIELDSESLIPPNPTSSFGRLLSHPYGHLVALTNADAQVMDRVRTSLSLDTESNRYAVAPSHMEYEAQPDFVFTPTMNDRASRDILHMERDLLCLWNGVDACDFDESLKLFGENAIRLLRRLEQAREEVVDTDAVGNSAEAWRQLIGSELAPYDDSSLL